MKRSVLLSTIDTAFLPLVAAASTQSTYPLGSTAQQLTITHLFCFLYKSSELCNGKCSKRNTICFN